MECKRLMWIFELNLLFLHYNCTYPLVSYRECVCVCVCLARFIYKHFTFPPDEYHRMLVSEASNPPQLFHPWRYPWSLRASCSTMCFNSWDILGKADGNDFIQFCSTSLNGRLSKLFWFPVWFIDFREEEMGYQYSSQSFLISWGSESWGNSGDDI